MATYASTTTTPQKLPKRIRRASQVTKHTK
jgi:hypothetical protein